MPEYKGRDILIKVGDGLSSESFLTLGGLQAKTITLNNEQVDVSNADEGRWRTLLAGAGLGSFSVSGNGVFKDDVAVRLLEDYAEADIHPNMQLIFPNGEQRQGSFQIATFEHSGDHNNAWLYNITLESSRAVPMTTSP